MIKWEKTNRGFRRGEFSDRYGALCSIQESSLATEAAIWLGCDHESHDDNGRPVGARMHLTREMAAELTLLLGKFAETGVLAPGLIL